MEVGVIGRTWIDTTNGWGWFYDVNGIFILYKTFPGDYGNPIKKWMPREWNDVVLSKLVVLLHGGEHHAQSNTIKFLMNKSEDELEKILLMIKLGGKYV
jgi:hypothetical protein